MFRECFVEFQIHNFYERKNLTDMPDMEKLTNETATIVVGI
uniref:Uncharacterized protein n=1 Tax=Arundo donax TaxID=35708 RepID=A0A0A9FY09_ARUDO